MALAGTILAGIIPCATAQHAVVTWMKPWDDVPHVWHTENTVLVHDRADTRGGTSAGIVSVDSRGRFKFDQESTEPEFAVGYRIMVLDVDSDLAAIDGTYWDVSLGGGVQLPPWQNGWQLRVWTGVGSANDGHFGESDSWYGLGVADFSYRWSDDSQLNVGLAYDGNRLFLPDIPLPYLVYRRALNEEWTALLGLPVGGLYWRPTTAWNLSLTYVLPTEISARVRYRLAEAWSVFVEYDRTAHAFALDDLDHRRLFYSARHVLGGLEWRTERLTATLAAGLAWDQEFERGFDVRRLRTITKVEDVPMLRVQLDARF